MSERRREGETMRERGERGREGEGVKEREQMRETTTERDNE